MLQYYHALHMKHSKLCSHMHPPCPLPHNTHTLPNCFTHPVAHPVFFQDSPSPSVPLLRTLYRLVLRCLTPDS